jgi:translation initiation factor 2 beta subunit (eIF-2beta)/eIF-5
MLKVKKHPYNSICISADSQRELGETFIRFQEYYESPNLEFRGKIFTLGAIKNWYSINYGGDTYSDLWVGFNFPSSVLEPFKIGLFDPLTENEKQLLDIVKYRNDNFYIIGAQTQEVLRHEISHALYGYCSKYRNSIDNYIDKNSKKFEKVKKYILDKGYSKEVINDELQAYITDNDDLFIINNLDPKMIVGINRLYNKYHIEKK